MANKSFKDLIVWQKAMDLVEETYRLVSLLPQTELYGLSSQMRRSAVSIPSNIAEGQKRQSSKEFAQFLSIAQGSNSELQTQFFICNRLLFLTEEQTKTAVLLTVEIDKMLSKFIQNLN